MPFDEAMMRQCLKLAVRGIGYVSPNPMVGAVLVKSSRIVSEGFHRKFGGPHAEVECLRNYNGDLADATLYVNLEPCCHFGKTPPCTDLLINSGIRNVVVAMIDPNPLVNGKGIQRLREAGINVRVGIGEAEARELNRAFIVNATKQRPFVHLKIAQSIDSKIAASKGRRLILTSKQSRTLVHRWRSEHDAVMVGAGTILSDDPLLSVRLVSGRDPQVVVVDGQLSLNPTCRLMRSVNKRKITVVTSAKAAKRRRQKVREFESYGATIATVDSKVDMLPLTTILKYLYSSHIGSILVEGGRNIFTQFMGSHLVDQLSVFIAPKIIGTGLTSVSDLGGEFQVPLSSNHPEVGVRRVGVDALIQVRCWN